MGPLEIQGASLSAPKGLSEIKAPMGFLGLQDYLAHLDILDQEAPMVFLGLLGLQVLRDPLAQQLVRQALWALLVPLGKMA